MRVNLDGKGYFRSDDKFAAFKVARAVSELMTAAGLKHKKDSYCRRPIVVMCIGTDRSTGDSLGPLVGICSANGDFQEFKCWVLSKNRFMQNLEEVMIKTAYQLPVPIW